jgi:hypothetical protein
MKAAKMNKFNISRRDLIKGTVLLTLSATDITAARAGTLTVSSVLGRPTSNSIVVNLVCAQDVNGFIEYGFSANNLNFKTESKNLLASQPSEFLLENLKPNSKIFYRFRTEADSAKTLSVNTAKNSATDFTFTVHGDTHPERPGKMFNEELYVNTLKNIANQNPDFHILLILLLPRIKQIKPILKKFIQLIATG